MTGVQTCALPIYMNNTKHDCGGAQTQLTKNVPLITKNNWSAGNPFSQSSWPCSSLKRSTCSLSWLLKHSLGAYRNLLHTVSNFHHFVWGQRVCKSCLPQEVEIFAHAENHVTQLLGHPGSRLVHLPISICFCLSHEDQQ